MKRGIVLALVGALLIAPNAEAAKKPHALVVAQNKRLTVRGCLAVSCDSWEQACRRTGRLRFRCVSRVYIDERYCAWSTDWRVKRRVVRHKKRKRVRYALSYKTGKPACGPLNR